MATTRTATTKIDHYTFTGSVNNTLYLQFQKNIQTADYFDGGAGTDKIQIRSSMAGQENFDVRGVEFRSFEQLSFYPMGGMDMPGQVIFSSDQFGVDGSGNALISESLHVIASGYSSDDYQKIRVYLVAGESAFDASDWTFSGWTSGSDTIALYGSAGANHIVGSDMADVLSGGYGNDLLEGGGGSDRLIGGYGADDLTGAGARDIFDFNKRGESLVTDRDIIRDFTHAVDDIDLSTIDASTRTANNQAFRFIGQQAFHNRAGELHYRYEGGNTIVEGDVNGDGAADFAIELVGEVALTKGDFIL